ncbi:transcription factor GTE1 isoform X4 [Physcomitrium patens]|uniref:transcription factor GTE1 isoform X4 n=1 Tax=Physcomitrium patens TaxID=3218 RepID=UPI000D16B949|nr:transcription factor GTE6-like isoform X5 [Physcomitrium patens]|eukprot:XP_024359481.1 transcription factor GTE6-like isoform X5 [Physcomitrella patens]
MKPRIGAEGEKATQLAQEGRGVRAKDGRPPLPTAIGQVRDSFAGANEDVPEISDVARILLKQQVQVLTAKVEEMERKVAEVTQKRNAERKSKGKLCTAVKDRDKGTLTRKQQPMLDISRRDVSRSKRMQELMRQVLSILRQISSHKWAWPFMKPVDVKGLGLHDYYEVIEKPMDLGTIKNKMDAKDASGYQHVQEVYQDVRLVFSNAMKYNPEGSDVYVMSKTLSEKFEEKWKTLVEPKLHEEEDNEVRTKEPGVQAVEEIDTEELTEQYALQLEELDKQLEDLKQQATPKLSSRAMSVEERRHLGQSLGRLPPDNLSHVIQIIAQKNPSFNMNSDEVEVDIDAQDPATLWRLQRYVQAVLSGSGGRQATPRNQAAKRNGSSLHSKSSSKRSKKVTVP